MLMTRPEQHWRTPVVMSETESEVFPHLCGFEPSRNGAGSAGPPRPTAPTSHWMPRFGFAGALTG